MGSDEELEEVRRKRLLELRRQIAEEQQREYQEQRVELQKQELLRKILTSEARQRLNRLKMVKPEFIEQLELQLIQLAQTGNVRLPITDEQLKAILAKLQSQRRETKFRWV